MKPLSLAYSPDADDAFMFWPIVHGLVPTDGLTFVHTRRDTEALNTLALTDASPDIVAVSFHQYAYLTDRYALLRSGASVGDGYGPLLLSRAPVTLESLRGAAIGVPGLRTTAYLALRLLLAEFEPVTLSISPFSRVFEAIRSGEVQAALVIHEGRLLAKDAGLHTVTDVGIAWQQRTGLPLPLGGTAVRHDLPLNVQHAVARVVTRSIAWSLAHRDQVIDALLREEQRVGVPRDRTLFDTYLNLYANHETLRMGDRAVEGLQRLYDEAFACGFLPSKVPIRWLDVTDSP